MTNPLLTDDIIHKGFDPQISRRLLGFLKPYKFQFFFSLFLMFLNAFSASIGPYLVKVAIDEGLRKQSLPTLNQTIFLYLIAAFTQWLAIFLRVNIMARVGQSIIYDLRGNLFSHLQKLSLSFFTHFSVGRVITRVINDVGVLREFITWSLLAITRDLFTLFTIIFAMFAMNTQLTLITFTVLPVMLGITILFRKQARENYRRVRAAISWVNSVLAENINGIRVVQAFSRQPVNFAHFREEVNYNNLQTNLKASRIAAAYPATTDMLAAIAISLVVWFGGRAVLGDASLKLITPGILVAFVLYIERFFDPIRDLSVRFDSMQSAMAGGERIFALLDTPAEVQDSPSAIELPPIKGEVRFENVSFHYFDDPTLVLKNINLHVHPGETIALVGRTGAGKSTLVKMISRFHDPTEGRITIDGFDLREVTQESLRSQMGIVLQDPFLFSGSITENIRFGRVEATDEQVKEAAIAVGADEFIEKLRLGYETPVEEGGVILSMGQRQLISFARALLADPRILILDEATSSVDTQTEIKIQKALARLLQNRTAFIIAHRLSTITNADRILVVEDGQIVEEGNHYELLAKNGVYARLYRSGFEDLDEE